MQAPGFLLLRDESDSTMHYLPPDDSGQLMQVGYHNGAVSLWKAKAGTYLKAIDVQALLHRGTKS